MRRPRLLFDLGVLLVSLAAPAMASSDSITTGPYVVYYGGYSTPVDSGYVEGMATHSFNNARSGTFDSAAKSLPWKPAGKVNSFTVSDGSGNKYSDLELYKEYYHSNSVTLSLSKGKSIAYFAHLKGGGWNATTGLFSLVTAEDENTYLNVVFNKDATKNSDSLTIQQTSHLESPGILYVLVDSAGKLFNPNVLKTGWVAVEARLAGTTPSQAPDFTLRLANIRVWFRPANSTTSAVSSLSWGWAPNSWANGDGNPGDAYTGFITKPGMDTVGDFAKIGPVSDTEYVWARNRFFGTKLLGDTTFSKPYIQQILYAPPGDQSYQQLTSSTTISSSLSTSQATSSSMYFGAGIEVTPEVLDGEVGISVEAKVNIASDINSGSSYEQARTITDAIPTNGCDRVLYENQKWYGFLLGHQRLNKVFSTTLTDSDYVSSFQLIPTSDTGLTSKCVEPYLAYVRDSIKDTFAVRNFHNLYVKDSLGKINTAHTLIKGSTPVTKSLTGTWPENLSVAEFHDISNQATTAQTQSFAFTLGASLDAKITAGGVSVLFGGSYSVTNERSVSNSTSVATSVASYIGDNEGWDSLNIKCYENNSTGLYACQSDSATSYSSGPWEPNTQKSVNLDYVLKETAGFYVVGDTIYDTLVITNNSARNLSGYSPKLQVALDGASDVLTPFTQLGSTWGQYSLPSQGQSISIPLAFTAARTLDSATFAVDVIVGRLDATKTFVSVYADSVGGTKHTLTAASGIESLPRRSLRSTELAANALRPLASKVSGIAQGRLSADFSGCSEDDCLSLSLALPSASTVSVSIFDQLGTPVISWDKTYTSNDLASIGTGADGRYPVTLSWNLRAANGAAVAPGVYLWKVDALTSSGQKLETVKKMGVK